MNEPQKYFIITFGCQMNESDSERIAGWYESKGWTKAKSLDTADEIIFNTCSVRESAENRVFGMANQLKKLKSANTKMRVILTGCMLRLPQKVLREKLPVVDEFIRIEELIRNSPAGQAKFPGRAGVTRNLKVHAYIPISNGCNNFCTYCVVPYARGREKSRPFDEIVCEVEELVTRGYTHFTLLGQNVNSYGKELKKPQISFAQLLRAIHNITGVRKISFITANPWDMTDEMIDAMSLPKVDRYLHLPLQSGDDAVLQRMNRHYTAQDYLNLVSKIRTKIPGIQIGTDIIVGFPGETDKEFENTVSLAGQIGFLKAYVARYSPRSGTAAVKLSNDVPHSEKKRRWLILENLINKPFSKP